MSNQETMTNPYRDLVDSVAKIREDCRPLKDNLESIEQELDARIKEVKSEFAPRIAEAQSDIEQNQSQRSPRAIRERLAAVYQYDTVIGCAVIDIYTRRWGGPDSFAKHIAGSAIQGYHDAIDGFDDQYVGFKRLEETLGGLSTGSNTPAMFFALSSIEYLDEQAQWEGRDSRTGEYFTSLTAVVGDVDHQSLHVRAPITYRDDMISPVVSTEAIDLHVGNVREYGGFGLTKIVDKVGESAVRIALYGRQFSHYYDPERVETCPKVNLTGDEDEIYKAHGPFRNVPCLVIGQQAVSNAIERIGNLPELDDKSAEFLRTVQNANA